ncbi:unnamed protein product [Adineta steineri]|uniref:G-protein coupled receptors family 1 profile domain-containing protein n=1 Tax=Adineta steineri TaxID=433720 RepID=A0A818TKC9_9BILA|nr:unnamed protein product [Adineta steineri]CAF3684398.1 unnamed protein product [Adineta steineri]
MYTYDRGDPSVGSSIFCKVRVYLPHVWGQMGRYFIVLASMDRFAMTSNSARLRSLSRLSVGRWLLGVFTVLWHALGSLALIMTTIQNGQCGQFGIYYIWYNVYSIATIAIIPLALTTIFGSMAFFNMKRRHARVGLIADIGNAGFHRRDQQLLKMVLAEVSVHFVTNILFPVITIEVAATSYMNASKSQIRLQIENLIVLVGRILFYTSNAASFYIFCTVSGTFRREFKEIICKCCYRTIERPPVTNRQVKREMPKQQESRL